MSQVLPKIKIGYRIGMLTVESKTEEKKNGYSVWLCRCDCGGEILLDTRYLQRGTITDCGCKTKVRPGMLDLTGQRFGQLVCIQLANEKDARGNTQWMCKCDCGNTCIAAVPQLKSGYKKSCGCLSHPPIKEYIGKRFGQLIVTAYVGKRDGMHRWECLCDCGKKTVVGQTPLQTGKTRSCGCLRPSQIMENIGFIEGTSVAAIEARLKRPPIATNMSGYNGVYRDKRNDHWVAQITFKRKTYYLGSYEKIEDAINARKRGEEMYENFLNWYYSEYPDKKKKN